MMKLKVIKTDFFQQEKKHPKCKGFKTTDYGNGSEYDCGYNTIINCEDCKYCLGTNGRKNPEAKINQLKRQK